MTIFLITAAVVTLLAVAATVAFASKGATRWNREKKFGLGVVFGVIAWATLFGINAGVASGTTRGRPVSSVKVWLLPWPCGC